MRQIAVCISLVLCLAASGALAAQQSKPENSPEAAPVSEAPFWEAIDESGIGDYCFGGKYESDSDINDGARITDEEIHRLLFPPTS